MSVFNECNGSDTKDALKVLVHMVKRAHKFFYPTNNACQLYILGVKERLIRC